MGTSTSTTAQQPSAQTVPITVPMSTIRKVQQSPVCLAQLIPSYEGEREAVAMETMLQGCSSQEPFSLELAGNRHAQCFLLRAPSEDMQETLCQQIRAQYP